MSHSRAEAPQLLDGAMALSKQSRRKVLLSAARGEGFRIADVLLGLTVILAVSAAFLDPRHAGISAIIACVSICSVLAGRLSRQMTAIVALLEIDRAD
jgi:hypothetical protein